MKTFFNAAVLLAALASGAVSAATYDFSYTFSGGDTVTGSLEGTLNGSFIDNISNVSMSFDGAKFVGTLSGFASDTSGLNYSAGTTPVVSFDGSKNNFLFIDATDPNSASFNNLFTMTNSQVLAVNLNSITNSAAFDAPGAGNWKLMVAAVPEPGSYAMLLAGLGLVGVVARRRRQA